jgi:hypothetical protein
MTEYKCIRCDITNEICCDSNGKELDITDPNDICVHCLIKTQAVRNLIALTEDPDEKIFIELLNL